MLDLIISLALKVGVDSNLAVVVAKQESNLINVIKYNDGRSTSYGPLQVKRIAARQISMNDSNMELPEVSIEIGLRYLKYSINKCGSIESGLSHFNTGKCLKYFKKNGYVDNVMKLYYNRLNEQKFNKFQVVCQNTWEEK